jgi:hypothetical protein
MSKPRFLSLAAAFAVLAPVGLFATVSRAQVPDALYYVGVVNSPQIDTIEPGALPLGPEDLIDDSTSFPGVLAGTACESGGGGCESSGASATAGSTVSASGSSTDGVGFAPIAGSQGQVDISYEVIGPGNVMVPLLISGNVSTSAVGPEAYALASIGWGGRHTNSLFVDGWILRSERRGSVSAICGPEQCLFHVTVEYSLLF